MKVECDAKMQPFEENKWKRVVVSEYKHVGIRHCVFCIPIPLRICLARALTKRKSFFDKLLAPQILNI